ncbi:hypothetical protein [Desulfotomaculum copahuensis]|uniref:Uncharacterized protein n=1 Tax=Desulfotomaculum copahuensis TaxID=1838280 RepID=A0A1B7LJH3_9FIRM|nr:hypothetical protein [Desulfotomaculum copahuensis]OAT86718.1 hypothetical protein A6M21_02565 [Desulfotomaculum copahuensis]
MYSDDQDDCSLKDFYPIRSMSLFEGLILGMLSVWAGEYLFLPWVIMLSGLYSAWRIGRLHRRSFVSGLILGSFAQGFMLFELNPFGPILPLALQTAAPALAGLTMVAVYNLAFGAYFFASYYRHPGVWLNTALPALILGVCMRPFTPYLAAVILLPVLALSLLPLWCASWRPLHAMFFAAVYLTAVYLGRLDPLDQWPVWTATLVLSLGPEILSYLNPVIRHDPDSLPVITPTLNTWQKVLAWREVFFLAVEFFGLTMEKHTWFKRVAPAGRYLNGLAVVLAILLPFLRWPLFAVWLTVPLLLAGLLLELGSANFRPAAAGLAVYGLGLAAGPLLFVGRAGGPGGLLAQVLRFHAVTLIIALLLIWLALVIDGGRPRESRAEREKWIALNRPAR